MFKQIFFVSSIVFISISSALCPTITTAQPVLEVTAGGTFETDADIIQLSIQLNSEDKTVDQAYRKNRQLQQKLIQLIKRYNVKQEDIQLQPLSINPYTVPDRRRNLNENGPRQEKMYRVRQRVSLTLKDREKYVDLQLALIKNGFDEFRGTYKSTTTPEASDKALQNAIQNAKAKASLISKEAGVQIKTIQSIEYHENEKSVRPPRPYESIMRKSDALVTEFDQVISITARVTITYVISEHK